MQGSYVHIQPMRARTGYISDREGIQLRVWVEDLASIAGLYSVRRDSNQSALKLLELL